SIYFFQAEDGIRDPLVTGVQTCALPICIFRKRHAQGWESRRPRSPENRLRSIELLLSRTSPIAHDEMLIANQYRGVPAMIPKVRSEERRVGKECKCGWAPGYRSKYTTWI